MSKIVLVTDNRKTVNDVEKMLQQESCELICVKADEEAEIIVQNVNPDVVVYDFDVINIDIIEIIRNLKFTLQTNDIRSIILLPENNINYDILKFTNDYVIRPFDKNLFISTVNSNIQLREALRVLTKDKQDLAKSLYQLNVLYTTSTQLAESLLDKTQLIEIMTDGLEQSLSLSLCYALILNETNDIKLIIKSLFPISPRLENAIKLRALLNYKNYFSLNPAIEDIDVIKYTKDSYGEYDLKVLNYDYLFSKINIKDKFYGIIEIFRETNFAQEDTKCFTTLVRQVTSPLESAILYEELKDTNHKLEMAEQIKSDFISIVSHELKTPLTAINGALDVLNMAGSAQDSTTEKFLNMATTNAKRLTDMISGLLDLSKIEAGKMEFKFERANINQSIEQLVKNTLDSIAQKQKISIRMNLNDSLENVYIDIQKMERVLSNLISNAIKFTNENGLIEITTSKIGADVIKNNSFFKNLPDNLSNEYIQIAVKDNGIGIAPENWNKVFEQFKQIENSLSRKVGGSGLGLSIAKRFMDAHKGFIWLDSELNKGTTFFLALPVMTDKEIFYLCLEQDLQKAKQDKMNIAFTALSEKITAGKSLINKILTEDVVRKTIVFKEYCEEKAGRKYYYAYAVDLESYVFDLDVRKLDTIIKSNAVDYKECDILYLTALYKPDGNSSENSAESILNKLNSFSKGDINEKNTDS